MAVEKGLVRIVVAKAEDVGVGTGFLLNDGGHIATNHHVVEDTSQIAVHFSGSSAVGDAAVLWSSSDLDLAVVATNPSNRSPVPLAGHLPEKGATVYALGFPGDADIPTTHGLALDATVTRGVLGRVFEGTWDTRELTVLQHDADISPGSSGGPLLDECGRVIGINTSGAAVTVKSADGSAQVLSTASGIYWASSVRELAHELGRLGIDYEAESKPCSASEVVSPLVAPTKDRSSDSGDGSGSFNAVWLLAATVALCLALLGLRRNNRRLEDLNSGNGTSLNGTPLEPYRPVRLGTGDRLQCGAAEFDVSIAHPRESTYSTSSRPASPWASSRSATGAGRRRFSIAT